MAKIDPVSPVAPFFKMTTAVFCRLTFEGLHRWSAAPDEVAFLRDKHRHIFHVRIEVPVSHDDRDVEFILLKRKATSLIKEIQNSNSSCLEWSCETWARELLVALSASRVEVSEDGENGAVAVRSGS